MNRLDEYERSLQLSREANAHHHHKSHHKMPTSLKHRKRKHYYESSDNADSSSDEDSPIVSRAHNHKHQENKKLNLISDTDASVDSRKHKRLRNHSVKTKPRSTSADTPPATSENAKNTSGTHMDAGKIASLSRYGTVLPCHVVESA